MALAQVVTDKIVMICSRRIDSACPQDTCAASMPMSTRATTRVEHLLRNPRDFELCNVLSSSFGYAWFMTHPRGCRRTQGRQHLFQVPHIAAESHLIAIGDADKFKAGDRPG